MSKNANTLPNWHFTSRTRSHTSVYQASKKEVEHDLGLMKCIDDSSQSTTASNNLSNTRATIKKKIKHFKHKQVDEKTALQALSLLQETQKPVQKSDMVIKIKIPKKKSIKTLRLPLHPQLLPSFILNKKNGFTCFANSFWKVKGFPQKYLSKFYEKTKRSLSDRENLVCPSGKGSIHTALAYKISQENEKIKLPQLNTLSR
ncbi:unnamed protein product [Blepharisma stoltei]|uniref:Uncharacterized protein n=1 Tax=Blepharisma stoltei TaxID=1481888 RepID=A0AAU9IA74_9CILI|nr:unnamed protein product [Blepharisma stoltei]